MSSQINTSSASADDENKINTADANANAEQKPKTLLWLAISALAILLVMSLILLTVRLYKFAKIDDRALSIKADSITELDVFSVSYEDDTGNITIKGADGEKVLAPGAKVDYTIRIRNTDRIAVDYDFIPKVNNFSQTELPIVVRMIGPDEEYLVGDAKTWVSIEEMDSLNEKHTLLAGECSEYLFQWKWAFETGSDDYDTWLGVNAKTQNIGMSMNMSLYATANMSSDLNGGWFGPDTSIIICVFIFVALIITAIALIITCMLKKAKVVEQEVVVQPEPEEVIPEQRPIILPPPLRVKQFSGKMEIVNLSAIEAYFKDGDVISLDNLKAKGLIRKNATQMKILSSASGNTMNITKRFIVETQAISSGAKANILDAGGEVHITNS